MVNKTLVKNKTKPKPKPKPKKKLSKTSVKPTTPKEIPKTAKERREARLLLREKASQKRAEYRYNSHQTEEKTENVTAETVTAEPENENKEADLIKIDKKGNTSEFIVKKSIDIIMQVDPNQELSKTDLMAKLQQIQETTTDLVMIEAIGYLLVQLENIEEKLEELEHNRDKQKQEIDSKRHKLEPDVFDSRIKLDSDEKPSVDECEQIYSKTKQTYCAQRKYLRPSTNDVTNFKKQTALKKTNKKIKELYHL